jgi:hypothetical protein
MKDMGLNAVFGGAPLGSGDHVKSQIAFADYYEGFGFFGGLTTLTTDTMYAVRVVTGSALTVTGAPVTLPKQVVLSRGWNFLPCPYATSVALADGAPTFGYAGGDLFKSQLQFSEFCEDGGTRTLACTSLPFMVAHGSRSG